MRHLQHLVLLCLAMAVMNARATAQADSANIPDFSIEEFDGAHFTRAQLKADSPVMIVYFSPTCEHCQHFGQMVSDHIAQFSGVQIVMITFRPLDEVADFTRICHLNGKPVIIGTEGLTFLVQRHYNVENFPFVAVYNSQGQPELFRDPPSLSALRKGLFGSSSRKVK